MGTGHGDKESFCAMRRSVLERCFGPREDPAHVAQLALALAGLPVLTMAVVVA